MARLLKRPHTYTLANQSSISKTAQLLRILAGDSIISPLTPSNFSSPHANSVRDAETKAPVQKRRFHIKTDRLCGCVIVQCCQKNELFLPIHDGSSDASLATVYAVTVQSRNNGVGKLPVMGYDTYNAFQCNYDGGIATAQAKAMNETSLVALGYNTLILDDCYTMKERDARGYMQANLTRFPGGMRKWTESINQFGVSGSAYSSNGYKTCGGYPGGYGHEEQDLET